MKKLCRAVDYAYNSVDKAVPIEIRERRATVGRRQLKVGACSGRDVFELGACHITLNTIRQGSVTAEVTIELHQMSQRKKQVFPSVVVEIVNSQTPSR